MTNGPRPPAISTRGLRKSYGDKVVLDGVDLAVCEGTIFSLLGPNGAGKTTAVKILSTLVAPDSGTGPIHVGAHDLAADPRSVRAAIGVTGQFSAVDGLITGEENMLLMADLHHLSRSEGRRVTAELPVPESVAHDDACAQSATAIIVGVRKQPAALRLYSQHAEEITADPQCRDLARLALGRDLERFIRPRKESRKRLPLVADLLPERVRQRRVAQPVAARVRHVVHA